MIAVPLRRHPDALQIGASIPHILASADGTGPVGGIGTSFISGKYAVLTGSSSGVKVAIRSAYGSARSGFGDASTA